MPDRILTVFAHFTVAKKIKNSYRNHVSNDATVQLDNLILVQFLISHMSIINESELHECSY